MSCSKPPTRWKIPLFQILFNEFWGCIWCTRTPPGCFQEQRDHDVLGWDDTCRYMGYSYPFWIDDIEWLAPQKDWYDWWFLWVDKLPQVSREATPYPSPARQEACQTCAPEGKKWTPRYFMIFHDISSSVQMGEVQWQLQSSIYRRVRCFPIEIMVFITAHKEVKLQKVTATPNGFVSNIDEAYRPTQNAVVYVYHHFSMVTKPYKGPAYYSVGPNITACHHFFRVSPID